jgi:hypothetical protein
MLGRSAGGIELGLPTQFHHCCVSIGIVFFTGIGGDINIASWARYKFIERFRPLYSQPSRGHQNTAGAANVNHSHRRLDLESDPSSHLTLSELEKFARRLGVRTPGEVVVERTDRQRT